MYVELNELATIFSPDLGSLNMFVILCDMLYMSLSDIFIVMASMHFLSVSLVKDKTKTINNRYHHENINLIPNQV